MRIERLEMVPYALPFREPYVTARGQLDRREIVLLRLHTDEGLAGLGEAVPLSLRSQTGVAEIVADLERCRGVLEQTEITTESCEPLVERCGRTLDHSPSLAAIDSALLDLLGKSIDRPAWWLMGAEQARPLHCNATLVAAEPGAVVADAELWAADGFDNFKLKVGRGQDVAQVAAVRSALGGDVAIRVDANGAWDVQEAVHKLAEMESYSVELAEQPAATLEEMADVKRSVATRIVADESVNDPEDAAQAVREDACDATTIKLAKVGGSIGAREIASLMPAYLSSALDGPVGIAAAAHVAQALPDAGLAHGLATQRLFAAWPASEGADLDGPTLTTGDAPGLGVEIDEAILQRLRLDVS